MTDDLIRKLMASGLSKSQATSVTAETLVNLFMPDDGKALIAEAQRQVAEMRDLIMNVQQDYTNLKKDIDSISKVLLSVKDAQAEYGSVSDGKAKEIIALYGALLSMNQKAGVDSSESVRNVGYIVYAYLGGQAKREFSYIAPEDKHGY